MAKKIKKYGKITLVLGLILVLMAMYLSIAPAQAALITNRETKISDSRPGQTGVIYDFEGDHTTTVVRCLRMRICTTATGTCTVPTGLVTTNGVKDSVNWSGWDPANWTGYFGDNGDIRYKYPDGEEGDTNYSFSTSNITNPTSAGTYFARVATYSDVGCNTLVDEGVTAFAIISGVTVTATVAETLTFTISDTSIGFGEIGTGAIRYATGDEAGSGTEPGPGLPSQLTLTTNASGGATITIHDIGNGTGSAGLFKSSAPTKLIAATAPNAVAAGTESYAPYGKNAGANLTIAAGFLATGTTAVTTSPQTFITATGPIATGNTADLAAKAGISGTTPAGAYADTIILVATPNY